MNSISCFPVTRSGGKAIISKLLNVRVSHKRHVSQISLKESSIKSYQDIPCPPGITLPVLGHVNWITKRPAGFERSWKNFAVIRQYTEPGVDLIRLHMPLSNPDGNGRTVFSFDPDDVALVGRNEGKYPNRGAGFDFFRRLRVRRPDLFSQTTGVLTEEGEKWHEVRSKVQQDMMRPKSAMYYTDKLQFIGEEFVEFIRRERNSDTLVIDDFLTPCHRFSLESIAMIALDFRLGCLEEEIPPNVLDYMKGVDGIMKSFPKMLVSFPWWKYVPPRMVPAFREVEDYNNVVADFIKEKLDLVMEKYKNKGDLKSSDVPIVEKLLERNWPNTDITHVMAMDMVNAGIDTTGNTLAFLLYNLARFPEKQEKLRQEILSFGNRPLTPQDIGQMRYLRACLSESMRQTATIPYLGRILPEDLILKNYLIPAKTFFFWSPTLFGKDPKIYTDPEEFRPERWIDEKKEIHPFAARQFGYGPRMCIGKRFAELEIHLATAILLKNFNITWEADYTLDPITELINGPDKPVAFKFVDR